MSTPGADHRLGTGQDEYLCSACHRFADGATDLLEALEATAGSLETSHPDPDWKLIKQARAALAKARGTDA